ncbi:MAG: AAA-like domain-containing protein [Chloroflexota bacterium]|nr:AAA-like domain-containing protein [Chloroflexota bacterium]
MIQAHAYRDLTPWTPAPATVPLEWMQLVETLAQQVQGWHRTYVLGVRYNAYSVGDLLRSWGLCWRVVVAGYLWEHAKEQIRSAHLCELESVLGHITEATEYVHNIFHENLPPLLNPPYRDPGGLLIAVATYYQALQTLQQQSNELPYTGDTQAEIERVGSTLLNIAKRLGMWYFKRDIEDLIEQLCYPARFAENKRGLANILERDTEMLNVTCQLFEITYREATRQDIKVIYTVCGVAGLGRRLQDAHTITTSQKDKAHLTGFDLVTFDVIVPTVRECYAALGVLSQLGHIQDRVTNQLAHPKANGCSHIALGLNLQRAVHPPHFRGLPQDTCTCQLQIATQLMQAITGYGCLHPQCYLLYTKVPRPHEIKSPSTAALWSRAEGRVFWAIQDAFSHHLQVDAEAPIIVYSKDRTPVKLPKGAKVLDFAYALDGLTVKYAIEAFINNRKAPLHCELNAGDVVEIITSSEVQVQDYWLDNEYATTPAAQHHIKDLLHPQHRGYHLLHQELEQYDYRLSSPEIERLLHPLLKRYKLGTPAMYLAQLDTARKPPFTPAWAAQKIMEQIAQRNESLLIERVEFHWVPALDKQVLAHTQPIHQQRRCGFCKPTYPQDIHITGRVRQRNGELIVHKDGCIHLTRQVSSERVTFIPMIWEGQLWTVRVGFFVRTQDRPGLIHDITRCLLRHQCVLLSINAEPPRSSEGHIRFVIETCAEQEAVSILRDVNKIPDIEEVDFDPAATAPPIYSHLQALMKRSGKHVERTKMDRLWKESIEGQLPRSPILKNPFDISRPATATMFVGRSSEMKTMEQELCAGEHGKALMLYGPRRSGKSSICKNFIDNEVKPPFWGVFFSLQAALEQNETALFRQLANEIAREFNEQLQQSSPDWDDYSDYDPQVRFKHFVQDCFLSVPGTRLVLALDEFGAALEAYEQGFLGYRFFTYWRELVSEIAQLSVLLVLPTSSHNLLISKGFSNLFSFAQPLPVFFLDKESAQRLLIDALKDQQIAMHPGAVAYAVKLTGGNPYYTTMIGQQLINQLNKDTHKQQVIEEDVALVVSHIIDISSSIHNFQFHNMEIQDEHEWSILKGLVELTLQTHQSMVQFKKIVDVLNLPAYVVKAHLERLCNGLILEEHGSQKKGRSSTHPYYSFKIELFRLWLSHNSWFFQR